MRLRCASVVANGCGASDAALKSGDCTKCLFCNLGWSRTKTYGCLGSCNNSRFCNICSDKVALGCYEPCKASVCLLANSPMGIVTDLTTNMCSSDVS